MFWEGFNKYVGVQGLLALILTIAIVIWISMAMIVPAEAWGLVGVSWGFYFAKNGKNALNSYRSSKHG